MVGTLLEKRREQRPPDPGACPRLLDLLLQNGAEGVLVGRHDEGDGVGQGAVEVEEDRLPARLSPGAGCRVGALAIGGGGDHAASLPAAVRGAKTCRAAGDPAALTRGRRVSRAASGYGGRDEHDSPGEAPAGTWCTRPGPRRSRRSSRRVTRLGEFLRGEVGNRPRLPPGRSARACAPSSARWMPCACSSSARTPTRLRATPSAWRSRSLRTCTRCPRASPTSSGSCRRTSECPRRAPATSRRGRTRGSSSSTGSSPWHRVPRGAIGERGGRRSPRGPSTRSPGAGDPSSPSSGDGTPEGWSRSCPASRASSPAPEPTVSPRRLLRVPAVQPGQRPAGPSGCSARGLEPPVTPVRPRRDRVWTRYVAIGDSFTEGMCDLDPRAPDAYVGWADRLAHHLDSIAEAEHLPFGYANLAVRGRKLSDVVGPQLDAALRMSPDLVSMVGGGNDLLRPNVDLDALASRTRGGSRAHPELGVGRPPRDADGHARRGPVQGPAGPSRRALRQHLHDRPAARLSRPQPLGHARTARLAHVVGRPHPPHVRGAPPGRPRRADGARPQHRPRRLDDTPARRRARRPP